MITALDTLLFTATIVNVKHCITASDKEVMFLSSSICPSAG